MRRFSPAGGDDAQAVGHRVEVDAELAARQRGVRVVVARGRLQRRTPARRTGGRVDGVDAAGTAQAVDQAVRRAHVDAQQRLAVGQAGDPDAAGPRAGRGAIEGTPGGPRRSARGCRRRPSPAASARRHRRRRRRRRGRRSSGQGCWPAGCGARGGSRSSGSPVKGSRSLRPLPARGCMAGASRTYRRVIARRPCRCRAPTMQAPRASLRHRPGEPP